MAQRTPQQILQRVMKVARFNGWTVVIIAGLSVLAALFPPTWLDLTIGSIVFVGGVVELRGLKHLRRRDDADRAITLLVRSQLLILVLIWIYSLMQLTLNRQSSLNEISQLFSQIGASREDFVEAGQDPDAMARLFLYVLYGTVSVASLFYQGGLALYYHRRRAAVREALISPPPLPPA